MGDQRRWSEMTGIAIDMDEKSAPDDDGEDEGAKECGEYASEESREIHPFDVIATAAELHVPTMSRREERRRAAIEHSSKGHQHVRSVDWRQEPIGHLLNKALDGEKMKEGETHDPDLPMRAERSSKLGADREEVSEPDFLAEMVQKAIAFAKGTGIAQSEERDINQRWNIYGSPKLPREMYEKEHAWMWKRRKHLLSSTSISPEKIGSCHLPKVGVAFGGGGVRSAAFQTGVMKALCHFRNIHFARRSDSKEWLKFVDFLSTVSGGGYSGSAYITYVLAEESYQREMNEANTEEKRRRASKYVGPTPRKHDSYRLRGEDFKSAIKPPLTPDVSPAILTNRFDRKTSETERDNRTAFTTPTSNTPIRKAKITRRKIEYANKKVDTPPQTTTTTTTTRKYTRRRLNSSDKAKDPKTSTRPTPNVDIRRCVDSMYQNIHDNCDFLVKTHWSDFASEMLRGTCCRKGSTRAVCPRIFDLPVLLVNVPIIMTANAIKLVMQLVLFVLWMEYFAGDAFRDSSEDSFFTWVLEVIDEYATTAPLIFVTIGVYIASYLIIRITNTSCCMRRDEGNLALQAKRLASAFKMGSSLLLLFYLICGSSIYMIHSIHAKHFGSVALTAISTSIMLTAFSQSSLTAFLFETGLLQMLLLFCLMLIGPVLYIVVFSCLCEWRIFGDSAYSSTMDDYLWAFNQDLWSQIVLLSACVLILSVICWERMLSYVQDHYRLALMEAFYVHGSESRDRLSSSVSPNVPYFIASCTCNNYQRSFHDDSWSVFTFTPLYFGGSKCGYYETPSWLHLSKAMVTSGAAGSPEMGVYDLGATMRLFFMLINADLSTWMAFPPRNMMKVRMSDIVLTIVVYMLLLQGHEQRSMGNVPLSNACIVVAFCILVAFVFASFFRFRMCRWTQYSPIVRGVHSITGHHYVNSRPPPLLNLTDGAHSDNLGIMALLWRKCDLILVSDSDDDPRYKMLSLCHTLGLAVEAGVVRIKDCPNNIRRKRSDVSTWLQKRFEALHCDTVTVFSGHLCIFIDLEYVDAVSQTKAARMARLIVIKVRHDLRPVRHRMFVGADKSNLSTPLTTTKTTVSEKGEHDADETLKGHLGCCCECCETPNRSNCGLCRPTTHRCVETCFGKFPHQSVANQFFTPTAFDDYHRLGRRAISAIVPGLQLSWDLAWWRKEVQAEMVFRTRNLRHAMRRGTGEMSEALDPSWWFWLVEMERRMFRETDISTRPDLEESLGFGTKESAPYKPFSVV
eukprot:g4478.t1